VSKTQDLWRDALDQTGLYARRYRWIRENPQAFIQLPKLPLSEMDDYIDQQMVAQVFKTGADLL
jgi:hypothetical protein